MEFIAEIPDKRTIQKQNSGLNTFLIENNSEKIEQILQFLKAKTPLLLINGFMGTGKMSVVNHALSFLTDETIVLKYNCFETTIIDDILLEFFDEFKKLTAQNIIEVPKAKSENFTQKINAYFDSINKPIVIVLNSFEQVLKDHKQHILDFINHLSKSYKIRIIIISRKFDYSEFTERYDKLAITALDKGIFERYLRSEDFKQIGPLSDELYRYSRGYFFYTTMAIKLMKYKKQSLGEFLSEYTKSFTSFNDYILREALTLVDPVSGHLFRFLTLMRHPVNVKLLKTINLYDEEKIKFFEDYLLIAHENQMIYLPDYYKIIAENSIAENIALKIHKSCVELYETQLPLKPLERDLLISRQTMRSEIEYHSLFIPKKPILMQKPVTEPQFIETKMPEQLILPPQNKQEKDEQIKKISFVFESEADEMAIMNKIATSINKFVDITDKKQKTLEEVEEKSLLDLINLAKQEEQNFEYQKVVMIYQKALTLNNDDDYYTFLPTLYVGLAQAFKKMSDWFNSQKYFELALEFYISAGDTEKINENRFEIANIYYITFKQDRAEKILTEILSEPVSKNLEIKSKLLLSSVTGKWVIKELPKELSEIEKPVLAELYFKYALNSDKEGDIDNAVKYYRKCVETSQDRLVNAYLSSALSNLASIYDEDGKSDMAVKYLQESVRLDELSKNYNGIYSSSMKLAEINSSRNPEKALDNLKRAKECAVELGETFYIASADVALGDFYYNRRDYKNALEFYNNAIGFEDLSKDNIEKIEMRIEDIKKVYNEE